MDNILNVASGDRNNDRAVACAVFRRGWGFISQFRKVASEPLAVQPPSRSATLCNRSNSANDPAPPPPVPSTRPPASIIKVHSNGNSMVCAMSLSSGANNVSPFHDQRPLLIIGVRFNRVEIRASAARGFRGGGVATRDRDAQAGLLLACQLGAIEVSLIMRIGRLAFPISKRRTPRLGLCALLRSSLRRRVR